MILLHTSVSDNKSPLQFPPRVLPLQVLLRGLVGEFSPAVRHSAEHAPQDPHTDSVPVNEDKN